MFEKCSNCGSRVVWGRRDELGIYCSEQCQSFLHFPGFCQTCADGTTAESAGSTTTLNGIGTRLYGGGSTCPACASIVQTKFFCLLFIPVIPLGKYRVRYVSPNRYLSRKLIAKSRSAVSLAANAAKFSAERHRKSEDKRGAIQKEEPMYCFKHSRYYGIECEICRLEQLALPEKPADNLQESSELRDCPACRETSLYWNQFTKLYECFNPRCRLSFTERELAARVGQQDWMESHGLDGNSQMGGDKMELSPEEKRKIYEEEKARLEAVAKPTKVELSPEEKRKIYEEERARLEAVEEPKNVELSLEQKRMEYEQERLRLERIRLEAIEKLKKKGTGYGMRSILVLVVILLMGALAWGGVTQTRLSNSEANLSTTKASLVTTQADLVTNQTDLSNTKATLTNTQTNLSQVQAQLADIKSKFPAHDFATVTDLEKWVTSHIQPFSTYADAAFRAALRVQEAGLQDGYLMSVNIEYDSTTDEYVTVCNALAGGQFYWWSPEQAGVYSWPTFFHR